MTHSLFTVMPAFVILFWLMLFYLDDNKNKAKLFFIFFLSIAFVNYSIHWCYFNHNYKLYYILDSIWVFTSLSVFPLYYYYIRLLAIDTEINYRWSWILIPAFALALFSATLYLMMSRQEIDVFTNEILYSNQPRSGNYSALIRLQILRTNLFKVIFTVEVILAVFFGLRLIKQFNRKLLAYYSDVQHRELSNIKSTLLFLMVAAFTSITSNIVGKDYFVNNQYLLAIPSLAHSTVLFGVSLMGYRQSFSIRELVKDQLQSSEIKCQKKKEKDGEGEILGSKYDELYLRMEYLLKEEQIFRDSDLRLNDLAFKLGTNRTYVSRLINNKANTNFCDYINSHRVRHAKKILTSEDGEQQTLDYIALESGFSSQSSFYRVFMKMEGTSPAKYRVEHVKQNRVNENYQKI